MAFLIVLSAAMASVRSAAYVLFDDGATDWMVGSEDALRWNPDVWPPGGTLHWEIVNAPERNDQFGFGSSGAFSAPTVVRSRWCGRKARGSET